MVQEKLHKIAREQSFLMNKEEIKFILSEGEGQFIEFKESLDKNFVKEIVAFTNGSGGKILLGVRDDGTIKGIVSSNDLKSRIQNIARNCDPSIIIDTVQYEDILIIDIKEGVNKPYSCSDGFYMRMGANSQKLKRDEILSFAIKSGKIRFDEQVCESFNWNNFDNDKFSYYLELARISNVLSKETVLKNLNLLTDEGITNAAVLLFAKEPYKYFKSSKVRCIHFMDDDRIDILDKKEVDKGIIGNIEFAINYIKERVPVEYVIKSMNRKENPEYSEEVYREAIVNAVVHRDYFDFNGDIAVEKSMGHIFINNPGGITFPDNEFGLISYPRNRIIADILSRTSFMEKAGTGIKRMKRNSLLNNNKFEIHYTETFYFLKIYSNLMNINQAKAQAKAQVKAQAKAQVRLNETELNILDLLIKENLSSKELVNRLNLKSLSGGLKKAIKNLLELKMIEYTIPHKIKNPGQKYRIKK